LGPRAPGLAWKRRGRMLEAFLEDRLDVIVATCAFGMGIDKPSVLISLSATTRLRGVCQDLCQSWELDSRLWAGGTSAREGVPDSLFH
jgi:hypothetical protein